MTKNTERLHKSAIAALNKGDMQAVDNYCNEIVKQQPSHADAWFLMGISAAQRGQMRNALRLIDRALQLQPQHIDYLSQKAKILCLLKQDSAARACADQACALNPQGALQCDTLGVVYTNLGDYPQARTLLAKAVALQPRHLQYQFNLATAEQFLGNTAAAKYHYLQAIAIQPQFARAYWALSELQKETLDGSLTTPLEQLLAKPNLSSEDQLYLSHALSREYEQAGDYGKAFEILSRAKMRRRKQLNYSLEKDLAIFGALQNAFSSLPKIKPIDPELGKECIFVVGMPRSGTTLVERILSSHSEVESLGELQNFGLALRESVASQSRLMLDDEVIAQALRIDGEAVGGRYLQSLAERRSESAFFIDKMPLNFLYIGFIARCLPGAKIICVNRNPMDTCISNFRQLFAMNFSYYNYHYSLQDTAHYIVAFRQLMGFWQGCMPGRVYSLNYESLTRDPNEEIARLLNACGLPWESACLNFHENNTAVATPSASQVREKLYTRAVGRWHKYDAQLKPAKAIFNDSKLPYN